MDLQLYFVRFKTDDPGTFKLGGRQMFKKIYGWFGKNEKPTPSSEEDVWLEAFSQEHDRLSRLSMTVQATRDGLGYRGSARASRFGCCGGYSYE